MTEMKYDIIHDYEDARENQYVLAILGVQHGVGFYHREEGDKHLCFKILVEDDENWFPSEHGASSWWFNELKELLVYVEKYMNINYRICKSEGGGWMDAGD